MEASMTRKTNTESGAKRMVELGYKPSQLWYTEEEYALVQAAARMDGRPMTQFAIRAAVAEAKRVLNQAKEDAEK
jgi:uncharacterized protein (DUF1778 family)